jgi:hypothetical protein
MNIDFHYGVIYTVSRLAGLDPAAAQVVAHACQYVDDATTRGLLRFSGGETFERFASAHQLFDYKNADNDENRVVWAPFHFLPGAVGESLEERALCCANSEVAKTMVRRALEQRHAPNGLHRLGVALHVYVDTWAHQGFSGTESNFNKLTWLEGDDHDHKTWLEKLTASIGFAEDNAKAMLLDAVSGLGHGAALHFPDMPWATWSYRNAFGHHVERVNLPQFVEAAHYACRVVQAFRSGNDQFETEPGLPDTAIEALGGLLATNQDHDEAVRFEALASQVASGAVPGLKEDIPTYIAKGPNSWKHLATGILASDDGQDAPEWSQRFEDSHYRKFHDALKEHRFVVTQQILPSFGVRLA